MLTDPKWTRMTAEMGAPKLTIALLSIMFTKQELKTCTPTGYRGLGALPKDKLQKLKAMVASVFRTPNFEDVWRKCVLSISNKCKRCRNSL